MIANPSPLIGDTTSCSKPTIYNQGSSISLETPQPPVMICNLALLQAQFSEVAPSVSVNVNTPDKVDAMLRHPFSDVFLVILFSWSRFMFRSWFFVGQKIQQSARFWAQVPVLQVFIPYVKTGWKNRKNAIDYRFGRERGFMSEKVCPAYCARAEGLQSGDSAKKSLQTMLLVGKRLCRKGRKMQSAMFFTIFCRWVLERRGKNLW